MNKIKQKLTLEEKCKILHALKDGTQNKAICMQYKVNKSTTTRIKNNNKNTHNFAKIFLQLPKILKSFPLSKYQMLKMLFLSGL